MRKEESKIAKKGGRKKEKMIARKWRKLLRKITRTQVSNKARNQKKKKKEMKGGRKK